MKNTDHNFSDATRQGWLRVMALAPVAALETAADLLAAHEFTYLAPPEIGLAMVRGRPGGSAAAFNLGEMTLTRCVVATTDRGTGARLIGHGHVAGRDRRHAELIARFDAVFQDSTTDAVFSNITCLAATRPVSGTVSNAVTSVVFERAMVGMEQRQADLADRMLQMEQRLLSAIGTGKGGTPAPET